MNRAVFLLTRRTGGERIKKRLVGFLLFPSVYPDRSCLLQQGFSSYSGGVSGFVLTQRCISVTFLGGRQLGNNRGSENRSEQRPEA